MKLLKVVAIEEEGHSIELQFQITLEWKEHRATYQNLKMESYLNGRHQQTVAAPGCLHQHGSAKDNATGRELGVEHQRVGEKRGTIWV